MRLLLALLLAAVLIGAGFWWVRAAFPSESNRAGQAALAYAKQTTVWVSGPSVQSVSLMRLAQLDAGLRRTVSPRVRSDVNVHDLIRSYGPNRQVALVVLSGVYNSLPPDEGVVAHGVMVSVVDARTNRVLLLTD